MATFMIVDDAAFMRNFLKDIIQEAGHEVLVEASNGNEAVRLFKKFKPEIITMDITMPDMDGITAVKQIMNLDSSVKIVMCSAMGQHKLVLAAIEAGAKDFISKPFQKDRVLESIINLTSKP